MSAPDRSFTARARNLGRVFAETRRVDPRMLPLALGLALAVLLVFVVAGLLLDRLALLAPFGVLFGLLVGLQVFSRRATSAAMGNLEGRPGAAAAVMNSLRRPWRVTPAVAFNRRQDFVHIAVGKPGIVLVAEGARAGATSLLKQERRRIARVAGETPIHEIVVGDGEGQVPLSKLSNEFMKLPRAIKKDEIDALDGRIKALGSSNPPMPKGPIPRGRRPR